MPRILYVPKALDPQFVRRVRQAWDGGLVKHVLTPTRAPDANGRLRITVAFCCDGSYDPALQPEAIKRYMDEVLKHLKDLYDMWNVPADLWVWHVSFVSLESEEHLVQTIQYLRETDIFYKSGIFKVPEAWVRQACTSTSVCHRLMEEVKRRVLGHTMAYIGVCGGAKWAGSQNYRGLPGLCLLGRVIVTYDSDAEPDIPTQAGELELHFTQSVAVAIVIWQGEYKVQAFPCIKKKGAQWERFCNASNDVYRDVVEKWAAEHMCFPDAQGVETWHSVGGWVVIADAWRPVGQAA